MPECCANGVAVHILQFDVIKGTESISERFQLFFMSQKVWLLLEQVFLKLPKNFFKFIWTRHRAQFAYRIGNHLHQLVFLIFRQRMIKLPPSCGRAIDPIVIAMYNHFARHRYWTRSFLIWTVKSICFHPTQTNWTA